MASKQKGIWNEHIAIRWTHGDIKELVSGITDEQVGKTIERLYKEFDASVGLNNDVICMIAASVMRQDEAHPNLTQEAINKSLNEGKCPVCRSKNLEDDSGFLVTGCHCKNCGWKTADGGLG